MSRLLKKNQFADADTFVFWDMYGGCKIPSGVDHKTVYENIKSALANEGYLGNVSVIVFGDHKNQIGELDNLLPAELFTWADQGPEPKVFRITAAIFTWGMENAEQRSNLMLITDEIQYYMSTLEFLGVEKNINVIVAQEDEQDPPDELTRTASEVWLWRSLSTTGGKPVYSVNNIWTRLGAGCPDPSDPVEITWNPNPSDPPT